MSMASETFRDRQRVKLREVAETVIGSEGLHAAQARRIAKDAGCSVGTLYNIFGDIDGLILAANQTTLHDLAHVLQADADGARGLDLEQRLMALALGYLEFASSNTLRWRAVFEHRLLDEYPTPDSFLEDRSHLLALIESELTSAFDDPVERGAAAKALFASVHGIVLLALDQKLGNLDLEGCKRQIRFVVSNVLKGIGRG